MASFAIIETGGKQYKVSAGKKIRIEKLDAEAGGTVSFEKVLMSGDEIGTPYVSGAKVQGKVLVHGREDKKIVFRYHSKTRYHKKKGHRQPYTEVEIVSI